jgi:hypothetical protein
MDHSRIDFQRLQLELPEPAGLVCLKTSNGHRTWTGVDADVLVCFLQRYVPPNRWQITALTGPPMNVEECVRRLADLHKAEQGVRRERRRKIAVATIGFGCIMALPFLSGRRPANPLLWNWALQISAGAFLVMAAGLLYACWLKGTEILTRLRELREELEVWQRSQHSQGHEKLKGVGSLFGRADSEMTPDPSLFGKNAGP